MTTADPCFVIDAADERAAAARRYRWMKLALPVKRNLDRTFEILTAE